MKLADLELHAMERSDVTLFISTPPPIYKSQV